MSAITLTDNHHALVHALATTRQKIAELNQVADHLKTQLIEALGDAEEAKDSHGCTLIRYKASRRFDPDKAAAFLSEAQLVAAQKTTIDAGKLKKMLTGEQLDACMIPGASRTFSLLADA